MIYRDPDTMALTKDPKRKGFHKRNRFGVLALPGTLYRIFKKNGAERGCTWKQYNAAFRKRRHKQRIAKESRRRNRR